MAFVVTNTNTKQKDDLDFSTWLNTVLDPNLVYAQYPELTGLSMAAIVDAERTALVANVTAGFVSEESFLSADETVATEITTWESQPDYENAVKKVLGREPIRQSGNITCSTDSRTVTGISTHFQSNLSINDTITSYNLANSAMETIGIVASIESDTSLTLNANASFNVTDKGYVLVTKKSALAFIQDLYNQTYPVTTETTFANV